MFYTFGGTVDSKGLDLFTAFLLVKVKIIDFQSQGCRFVRFHQYHHLASQRLFSKARRNLLSNVNIILLLSIFIPFKIEKFCCVTGLNSRIMS